MTDIIEQIELVHLSEFELHARAVLGLPIAEIVQERVGASAVILADKEGIKPSYIGLNNALNHAKSNVLI